MEDWSDFVSQTENTAMYIIEAITIICLVRRITWLSLCLLSPANLN